MQGNFNKQVVEYRCCEHGKGTNGTRRTEWGDELVGRVKEGELREITNTKFL